MADVGSSVASKKSRRVENDHFSPQSIPVSVIAFLVAWMKFVANLLVEYVRIVIGFVTRNGNADEEGFEDVDFSGAKQFEIDVAGVLQEIGVILNHEPHETGQSIGIFGGTDCRPDITGSYKRRAIVVDTKKYDKSYITIQDINKLVRDSRAMGGAFPILINSGNLISKDLKKQMNKVGLYIEVPYPYRGWEEVLKREFLSRFPRN